MNQKRNTLRVLAGGALAAATAGLLAACSGDEKPQFKSIDLTGADYAKDFSLADQNGKVRTVKDFAGKVVVVFFGYTQCPDVCPTSMAELAQIKKNLGADGDKLQAVFISVDPERDTPEVLKAYMGNFDPSFLALRPTMEQLPQVTKDFKIYYKKVDGKTPGSYSMDHTAGSYVFDIKGNLRLYSRYGNDVAGFTSDIRQLLKSA
ncbi:MAG: SCO family protein [Polaromonas sp.]|uniref:SCO family protein n=1 Tax=Polaromonas sp. TaxID=1869339 RepID=UPI0025F43417|nr:SCO family protein [Polaromonas sp.]MBI2726149.1 SCO family protein [Polaromonas sp.]